jgi:hypothetical protein
VCRNLFQRGGTPAGTVQLAIVYLFNPWLDRREVDWSSWISLLQGLE